MKLLKISLAFCLLAFPASAEDQPQNIQSSYEVISLRFSDVSALQREVESDEELYEKVVAMIEEKKAVLEKLHVVRSRAGEAVTVMSAREYIYPTEYEPAELPNAIGVDLPRIAQDDPGKAAKQLEALKKAKGAIPGEQVATPATPSAFEMKYVGDSLELVANPSVEGKIQLVITPNHIRLKQTDYWGQGLNKQGMPRFVVQTIRSQVSVSDGEPTFLGTISPPRISQSEEKEPRVWLAFLTVRMVE